MEERKKSVDALEENASPFFYESPRIEAVLTPEELEREVLYAGGFSQPG